MFQTTVEVDGMACSMCEAHINDTIRSEFPVEKVSSSHSKGRTVILSKEPLDEKALRAAIEGTGYQVGESNGLATGKIKMQRELLHIIWCGSFLFVRSAYP